MSNTAKTIFGAILGIMIIGLAFRIYDVWRWNQPIKAPVATVASDDVEVEPTSNWTTAKQVVYEGCMSAEPFDDQGYYCRCVSDYAIDTYGFSQISEWGADMPPRVLEEVVSHCL